MMPLGGVAVAVLAGWALSRDSSRAELGVIDGRLYTIWRFLVRYVVPLAIASIFIANLGS